MEVASFYWLFKELTDRRWRTGGRRLTIKERNAVIYLLIWKCVLEPMELERKRNIPTDQELEQKVHLFMSAWNQYKESRRLE